MKSSKRVSSGVKYVPGTMGGRGRHPNDPTGEFYGDSHWPLPLPHERGDAMKYMLVDITTVEGTRVLLVGSLRQVQLHGVILKAQGRNVIAPPVEARAFSKFEVLPLQYLYWNVCQKPPTDNYGELVQNCLAALEALPVDNSSLEALEIEAAKWAPVETQDPGSDAPKERKPRPVATTGTQPKATTTTGLVWVLADEVLTKMNLQSEHLVNADWKTIRTAVIAACEKEGINPATAATQYSKFKASKLSGAKG